MEDVKYFTTGQFDKFDEVLNELAGELITNYCTVAFGDDERKLVMLDGILKSQANEHGKPIAYPKLQQYAKAGHNRLMISDIRQHRNILIIGAGASHDSYAEIPLGKKIIDTLIARYEQRLNTVPSVKEKYENAKKEIEQLSKSGVDFESYMAILAELIFTPDELRKELTGLVDFKNCPSLFYEIVAHMFKHSFIDVIINFNFDELLDNAIEEEMEGANYKFILSDGDCVPVDDIMVDGRLKVPIYIKPHGTISHKHSLRFTKRHYLDIPGGIKEMLSLLINGKRGKSKSDLKRVNIICVGFNMQSVEFMNILNESLPADSRIYHFTYESFPSVHKSGGPSLDCESEEYLSKASEDYMKAVLEKFYDRALNSHPLKSQLIHTGGMFG